MAILRTIRDWTVFQLFNVCFQISLNADVNHVRTEESVLTLGVVTVVYVYLDTLGPIVKQVN